MEGSNFTRWLFIGCHVGLIVLFGTGCKPPPPAPKPCTLPAQVALVAGDRINLDPQGKALPTVVRLYQLKQIIRVEESDFEALWERPDETLAEDLVEVQEFTLFPRGSEIADVSLDPETHFLVAMAVFRRPVGTQWRSIIPIPASEKLCAAYEAEGAPNPAVVFNFDTYRVDGRSRLLNAGGDTDLPFDVAPDTSGGQNPGSGGSNVERAPGAKPPSTPSGPNAPSSPDAPSAPDAPSSPSAPEAPTAPKLP